MQTLYKYNIIGLVFFFFVFLNICWFSFNIGCFEEEQKRILVHGFLFTVFTVVLECVGRAAAR